MRVTLCAGIPGIVQTGADDERHDTVRLSTHALFTNAPLILHPEITEKVSEHLPTEKGDRVGKAIRRWS